MYDNNIGNARWLYSTDVGGFTQEDAASALGFSVSTYRNYEQGRTEPGMANLAKIAKLYGCSVDYLVGLPDHPQKEELTSGEQEILELYRKCDDTGKRAMLAAAQGISYAYVEL